MDASPIVESTGLPHASRHPGVMHALGHDGHTAMLLAAAYHLATQGDFNGTLNLIFQPAEEGPGGARRMIEDGLFTKYPCDAIFAMHNLPGHAQGRLLLRDGATMGSCDNVTITLDGTGDHRAVAHRLADPLVAGAAIVMGLQDVVARDVDPLHMAEVTVGAFQAGRAHHVAPPQASLKLSVRALDSGVRDALRRRITELVQWQASSHGVRATVDYQPKHPVLVNSRVETDIARRVALELLGPGQVDLQTPALIGSEDFAVMLQQVPGSYVLIGNGEGADDAAHGGHAAVMGHDPHYDFDDRNLPVGAAYWALLAQSYLA